MDKYDSIVLIDGICNFCSFWARFICRRDRENVFHFSSLQSEMGKKILMAHHLGPNQTDSIVFIEGEACYTKSSAVLHIAKRLGYFWGWLYIFILVPRKIRDGVYDFIAKKRFIFGKAQCLIPSEEIKERFLDYKK